MVDFAQYFLVAVACVIVPVSLLMWLLALDRIFRGQPLLELVPRRPVPWSLIDLLLIGLVALVILGTSQWICAYRYNLPDGHWGLGDLNSRQQIGVLITSSISVLITWLATVGVCHWRSGATPNDLGIVRCQWQRDIAIGIGTYVMLIVPVLGIHFVAQILFPTEESHPFIDLIMKDPRWGYLLPIAFAALVAAPIAEEFLFRVLLQGWLERLTARLEPQRASTVTSTGEARAEPECEATATPPIGPLAPPSGLPNSVALRVLAITVSSTGFALAHFGQGPAPISLFFLALGLGYVYQRTHRIVPTIIAHFLVNLTAVIQLAIAVADQHR